MENKIQDYACITYCIGIGDTFLEFGVECLVVTLMNQGE